MPNAITAINSFAFQLMKSIANPTLNSFMALIAADMAVIAVLVLLAFYLYYKKDKNVFTYLFTAIAIYVISDLIKLIVHEPRPCTVPGLSWINTVGCDASTFSFPSNHATMLTGLSLFVGAYKYLRILYVIWLVLILVGRVYLGAHYLTDVIAGMAIGLIISWAIRRYSKKINAFFASIAKRILPQLFDIRWRTG